MKQTKNYETLIMFDLQAKSSKEADMLMYGSISEWGRVRAEDFINKIIDVKSKGYERLKLKINSPGGSQFEGLAIMSQMGSKEVYLHGVVEGMAASMAGIILQGCDRRSMVKGTRLMVHQGSGGVFGSANYIRNYADLVTSMDKTLAEILAKRSKREAKYILDNWMAEGKDTWFSPEEALKEGLIDDIIEGNVVPIEKEQASLMELAAHYEQQLDTKNNLMNKEELIKTLGLKANATDAEILAAVVELNAKATKTTPAAAAAAPPAGAAAASGEQDLTPVIDGIVALAKERGLSDAQIESVKVLAKTNVKAAMAFIPAKTAETATTEKKEVLSVADVLAAVSKTGNSAAANGGSQERADWNYTKWSKEDSDGLMAMAKNKTDDFIKLFAKQHGYTPTADEIKNLIA
jgi:ATP-dependent Clp endopeptidase proteolytic subunit ClpP